MVARIPSRSRPTVKLATGMRLFCSVIRKRFRASIPPFMWTSTGLRVVVLVCTPRGVLVAAIRGAAFLDHLLHAHARRDHRVHVRLGVYVEVQDRTPRLLLRPPDRRLDVVALAHRLAAQTIGRRHLLVARPADGCLRVAAGWGRRT